MFAPPAIGPAGKSTRRLCSANSTFISRQSINPVKTLPDRERSCGAGALARGL